MTTAAPLLLLATALLLVAAVAADTAPRPRRQGRTGRGRAVRPMLPVVTASSTDRATPCSEVFIPSARGCPGSPSRR
jgi:hypothetical protein